MLDLIRDLWAFMRERKKFWLLPIVVILLVLGGPVSYTHLTLPTILRV